MNFRIFVEKKPRFRVEAETLLADLNSVLGLGLKCLRLINVYDLFGFSEDLLDKARFGVFGDVVTDDVFDDLSLSGRSYVAVEPLPGQFDCRSAAAVDCIRLIDASADVSVRSARILLFDDLVDLSVLNRIRDYVINAVDSREKDMSVIAMPALASSYDVPVIRGFRNMQDADLMPFCSQYGLAMSVDDLDCVVDYFRSENRDPNLAEIRVLDTYWSDHCRHSTFNTVLENISVEDSFIKSDIVSSLDLYYDLRDKLGLDFKERSLMDVATIGARFLRSLGVVDDFDMGGENNACGAVVDVGVDGVPQKWIILFKNETHNHPTEIEPYGGAATCLGGAIRDPLAQRAYVYQAVRISGAGDIYASVNDVLEGKLPQRFISVNSARGYADYGNRIGVATSFVHEVYHPGYVAKHLELGAVVGAARFDSVSHISPCKGDVVLLIGGRTGRDGIGGATGSSRSHNLSSLTDCSSEVQKGNPVEERKLQHLFCRDEVTRIVKCANDFGAGGVAVAVGELADGIDIYLDRMPVKYEGLNVTELAISESQERMAVVVDSGNLDLFISFCREENVEAVHIADVTDSGRLRMFYDGAVVVDLEREFVDTAGAARFADAVIGGVVNVNPFKRVVAGDSFAARFENNLSDDNVLSQIGLAEIFDSSIGRGSVLMPFGGALQRSESQVSVQKVPVDGFTYDASMVAYGFNPFLSEWSPYHGAAYAVVDVCAKVAAAGGDFSSLRLSFQEFFERMSSSLSWGKPLAALLGALRMQCDLHLPAVGGKDSMSGSFQNMNVPPSLIAFGFCMVDVRKVVSSDFKRSGEYIYLLRHSALDNFMPDSSMLISNFNGFHRLVLEGKVTAAFAVGLGGVAEAVSKMSFGSGVGAEVNISESDLFDSGYGSIVFTSSVPVVLDNAELLGVTVAESVLRVNGSVFDVERLFELNTRKFASVFPNSSVMDSVGCDLPRVDSVRKVSVYPGEAVVNPVVYIPVFPGTNCDYDMAKAFRAAGADVRSSVFCNLSALDMERSIKFMAECIDGCHILALAGGFSAGDEPDGSAKFMASVLKNSIVAAAINRLIARKGLILGICNGFQALVKSGLLPFGCLDYDVSDAPALFRNAAGHHISRMVSTCVSSVSSPWLDGLSVGEVHSIPISHGEGRFLINEDMARRLFANGQVAFQYCDFDGVPSMSPFFNPNGSDYAVEGVISADGLILGKMGHSERYEEGLFKNIYGNKSQPIFENAVRYFRKLR